jgi:hypothetical protein
MFFVSSSDGGRTWSSPVTIADERSGQYCEPDIEEVAPGEILCVLRDTHRHGLDVCRSLDGGTSWSAPEQTSMRGLPGHLLKLADGRVLCAYGRRKAPFGIRMCLSEDGGRTWETGDEILVRDDLPNGDLGYPTTIEYEPGRIFVCYYGQEPDGVTCVQGTYVDLA